MEAREQIPFITDVRVTSVGIVGQPLGIVLTLETDDGHGPRLTARSVCTADAAEELGRALLSIAAMARLNRDSLSAGQGGQSLTQRVNLMRSLRTGTRHSVVRGKAAHDPRPARA